MMYMSIRTIALFLTALLVKLACLITIASPYPHEVTIKAAYTSNRFLFLMIDGKIMYVDKLSRMEITYFRYFLPNLDTNAAYSLGENTFNFTVMFYGQTSGVRSFMTSDTQDYQPFSYIGENRVFLGNGGPDAAAMKSGIAYFFKGCLIASVREGGIWTYEGLLNRLGIPCSPDAAWNDRDDAMFVLKGKYVWRWNEDDSVTGPTQFHELYELRSWRLKPDPEGPKFNPH